MTALSELRANRANLSIADLESEHRQRDEQVTQLRGEMREIHDMLEPMRLADQAKKAGPGHLAQTIGTPVKLDGR